jgi:tRNA-splicing ligase RtcB
VLLPGTHRTSSYLAVAGPDSARSLYSACHGAGTVIDDFLARGLSAKHRDGHSTRRFRYSDAAPMQSDHLDDNGVNAALGVLQRHGLVRPVARMRPFAVLN